MTKSTLKIANKIVEACPYTAKMKSAHKMLLIGMIAEELERQRQEGFGAGYENGYRHGLDTGYRKDPLDQALNEGKGVYKP